MENLEELRQVEAMGRYARLMQGFQWIPLRTEGAVRHLTDFVKSLGRRRFSEPAKTFLRDWVKPAYSPSGVPRMKVGFFTGCAMDFIYHELGLTVIDLLVQRRNIEVAVPEEQDCRGAAIYFSGEFETGRFIAEENIRASQGLDYTVTACGMDGPFSVFHHDLTKKIAAKKMEGTKATGADILVTACPGCMTDLIDNVLHKKMPQEMHHLLELVQ